MSKQKAALLLNDYVDFYGRITLYRAELSDARVGIYDSENNGLWSGEALVLLKLNGLLNKVHEFNFNRGFVSSQVTDIFGNLIPGLYSRHPAPFWQQPDHHIVSWDEYNGLILGSIILNDEKIPKEVIEYGRSHFYSYIDGNFGKLTFKQKVHLYFSGLRQPRDFFFFKIAAGIKPNLFETIWASISHILTSRKPKDVTSGKIMAWCKQKALKIKGYDGFIWRQAKKVFDKNMIKQYGKEEYMEEIARIYYRDKDHPFHELFKGLK